MKVKLNLLCGTLLLAAGTYLSGCTDKGTTPGVPQVSKGEPIQFSVGAAAGAESRTEYVNSFLLDWNVGDQIRIRCAQADPISADYQIAAVTSDQWGSLSPVDGNRVMKWGDEKEIHSFYAAYPASRVMDETSVSNGEFSMKYMTNQLDTVVSLSNGAYLTNPDMNNAYMMAMKTVKMDTAKHHVRLDFDPIMTTFDITVRAGKYEVATGIINPVTVTGVSVIMPNKIKTDRFTYDANGGTTADEGEIKEDDIDKGVSQSVYVGVRNGTSRYVDLHEGETLNLMAFLPPVDMNANAGGENNKVRIMVHTTGMDYVMSVDGDRIEEQNKYFIQLPDMSPDDSNVNNWMSELDPSTPLNKLSIPAYVCTGDESEADITGLLEKGVRAFDINEFCSGVGIVTGKTYQCSLDEALTNALKDFLANKKEIVIIWLSNSDKNLRLNEFLNDIDGLSNIWGTLDLSEVSSSIQSLLTDNKKLIVVKKNTSDVAGYYNWFNRESESPLATGGWLSPRTNLFPYKDNVTSESLSMSEDWWGAQFVAENADSINKKLYEYISAYDGQTGCTGIVTIPNAKDTYVNGQYTYSDLLIQSIIDCNFKFRH